MTEELQDDSNSPLEFEHQNTAEKAWGTYAPPYVHSVLFGTTLLELLKDGTRSQESSKFAWQTV